MSVRILAVDDSATTLRQLESFLTPHGYTVIKAASASDGIDAVRTEKFDLLIVDVNMPGMNGLEMIREVRAVPGYEKTPCFVLTTESTRHLMEAGRKVGATAWIVKPFKHEILLKGIQQVLATVGAATGP
jgi:two-component system, chemotaxis family, chemotaxis protein CheY